MAMREADIGSDHELIKTKIRIKLKTQSQQVYQGRNTFDATNLQRTYKYWSFLLNITPRYSLNTAKVNVKPLSINLLNITNLEGITEEKK
jgi:hypothetical protein